MKKLSKLLTGLFILTLAFSFVSCDNDDDPVIPQIPTIAEFVQGNADYSLLRDALIKADLAATLNGNGPFTVFAPNNAALTAFLNANNISSLDDVTVGDLKQILLNHVVSGAVKSTDLTTGYVNTLSTATPGGGAMSLFVNTDGGVTLNGVAKVTKADNILKNGVVHLVDKVIGLPTVVTFATADPTFSTLVTALTREDQEANMFVATLSTANGTAPAPFTVFAPTNDAFASLLADDLGGVAFGDVPGETLTAALKLHVVAGANVTVADLTDGTVTTLGGDITASKTNSTLTDANGRVSNITTVDVQASNGVIHVIDKVVLPKL